VSTTAPPAQQGSLIITPLELSPIEKPLQGYSPCHGFVGHCQADMLKGVNADRLHDFNPPKRFRQRAEHIKEARRLCNEASFTNQKSTFRKISLQICLCSFVHHSV
jgi:hypothetical protein